MTQMRSVALALLAAALLALPAAVHAQGVPSDGVLRDFEPSSEYMLLLNGKQVGAEIYQNDKIPAFLVLSSSLSSPVMLTPRTGSVQTVNLMKVSKQKDGSVDLLADAVLAAAGTFQMDGENVKFTVEGKTLSLSPKPALTGLHSSADLLKSLPEYVRNSQGYTPNAAAVAALRKNGKPVTVHVVFGSWCPHCRQHVPMMLRAENEIKNPKIKFEYYGINKPPDGWKDPEVKRLGVKGIPTAVVYVNGVQAGRIEGTAWSAPEVELNKILNGSGAAKGK
jgi:thiol-disulfide isomerase/thioredoxin